MTEWKNTFLIDNDVHLPAAQATATARLIVRDPTLFDHFTTLPTRVGTGATDWTQTETGTGTSHQVWTPSPTTGSGEVIGISGATNLQTQEIGGQTVIWKPSTMAANASIIMEVRAKFVAATTAADGDFAIGFADANHYGAGAFVISATSTVTSTATTEYGGFFYSSLPSSGVLKAGSGNNYIGITSCKAGTKGAIAATTVQKDSNYHIYRVAISANGSATCSIDGVSVGTIATALTASVALTPFVSVETEGSHANTGTIDYIFVGGGRV